MLSAMPNPCEAKPTSAVQSLPASREGSPVRSGSPSCQESKLPLPERSPRRRPQSPTKLLNSASFVLQRPLDLQLVLLDGLRLLGTKLTALKLSGSSRKSANWQDLQRLPFAKKLHIQPLLNGDHKIPIPFQLMLPPKLSALPQLLPEMGATTALAPLLVPLSPNSLRGRLVYNGTHYERVDDDEFDDNDPFSLPPLGLGPPPAGRGGARVKVGLPNDTLLIIEEASHLEHSSRQLLINRLGSTVSQRIHHRRVPTDDQPLRIVEEDEPVSPLRLPDARGRTLELSKHQTSPPLLPLLIRADKKLPELPRALEGASHEPKRPSTSLQTPVITALSPTDPTSLPNKQSKSVENGLVVSPEKTPSFLAVFAHQQKRSPNKAPIADFRLATKHGEPYTPPRSTANTTPTKNRFQRLSSLFDMGLAKGLATSTPSKTPLKANTSNVLETLPTPRGSTPVRTGIKVMNKRWSAPVDDSLDASSEAESKMTTSSTKRWSLAIPMDHFAPLSPPHDQSVCSLESGSTALRRKPTGFRELTEKHKQATKKIKGKNGKSSSKVSESSTVALEQGKPFKNKKGSHPAHTKKPPRGLPLPGRRQTLTELEATLISTPLLVPTNFSLTYNQYPPHQYPTWGKARSPVLPKLPKTPHATSSNVSLPPTELRALELAAGGEMLEVDESARVVSNGLTTLGSLGYLWDLLQRSIDLSLGETARRKTSAGSSEWVDASDDESEVTAEATTPLKVERATPAGSNSRVASRVVSGPRGRLLSGSRLLSASRLPRSSCASVVASPTTLRVPLDIHPGTPGGDTSRYFEDSVIGAYMVDTSCSRIVDNISEVDDDETSTISPENPDDWEDEPGDDTGASIASDTNAGAGKRFSFPNNASNITNSVTAVHPHRQLQPPSAYASTDGTIEIPDLGNAESYAYLLYYLSQARLLMVLFDDVALAASTADTEPLEPLGVPTKSAQRTFDEHFTLMHNDADSNTDISSTRFLIYHSRLKLAVEQPQSTQQKSLGPPPALPIRHARRKSVHSIVWDPEVPELVPVNAAPVIMEVKEPKYDATAANTAKNATIGCEPRLMMADKLTKKLVTINPTPTAKHTPPPVLALPEPMSIVVLPPPAPVNYKVDFVESRAREDSPLFGVDYAANCGGATLIHHHRYPLASLPPPLEPLLLTLAPLALLETSTAPSLTVELVLIDLTDDNYDVCTVMKDNQILSLISVSEVVGDREVEVVLVDDENDDELASLYSKYRRNYLFRHSSTFSKASSASRSSKMSKLGSSYSFHADAEGDQTKPINAVSMMPTVDELHQSSLPSQKTLDESSLSRFEKPKPMIPRRPTNASRAAAAARTRPTSHSSDAQLERALSPAVSDAGSSTLATLATSLARSITLRALAWSRHSWNSTASSQLRIAPEDSPKRPTRRLLAIPPATQTNGSTRSLKKVLKAVLARSLGSLVQSERPPPVPRKDTLKARLAAREAARKSAEIARVTRNNSRRGSLRRTKLKGDSREAQYFDYRSPQPYDFNSFMEQQTLSY